MDRPGRHLTKAQIEAAGQALAAARAEAAAFNLRHRVGTRVRFQTWDDTPLRHGITTRAAFVVGGHRAMVWVRHRVGWATIESCISVTRITTTNEKDP